MEFILRLSRFVMVLKFIIKKLQNLVQKKWSFITMELVGVLYLVLMFPNHLIHSLNIFFLLLTIQKKKSHQMGGGFMVVIMVQIHVQLLKKFNIETFFNCYHIFLIIFLLQRIKKNIEKIRK